jgi:hypothetical protein
MDIAAQAGGDTDILSSRICALNLELKNSQFHILVLLIFILHFCTVHRFQDILHILASWNV